MKIIWYPHANRKESTIALTFDDGPNPYFTPIILKILNETRTKGNFFLIGQWAYAYKEIVKEILGEGHLIGNHSYSHNGDFDKGDVILKNVVGWSPTYFRMPYGMGNPKQKWLSWYKESRVLTNQKVKMVDLDVNSGDWKMPGVNAIIKKVINQTQNGSIIDFHDGSEKTQEWRNRPKQLVQALPHIIDSLKEKRFSFRRLDELSFKQCDLIAIESELIWGGKLYKLEYVDTDNFENLPQEKCRQIYGICFYNDKLVIVYNSKTKLWNFIGGSIKIGETFDEALPREIKEESNMELLNYVPIGYQKSTGPDGDSIYQLRTACAIRPYGHFIRDPDEAVIEIKLINPRDYKKYFDWGAIGDRLMERAQRAFKKD